MAINNRDEANAAIDTALVATLTLTQHKALLKDELNNSSVFRKDVIASETPAGGNVTIDYANKDTATVSITANLAVSFTNLENGDVKYLHITKQATNTVSFAGATDTSPRKKYINTTVTSVVYVVTNKDSVVSVNSINIGNNVTADLQTIIIVTGDWNMNFSAGGSPFIDVAHGIADITKIRKITATIRNNADTIYYPIDAVSGTACDPLGGIASLGVTNVRLRVALGGLFDSTNFDSTSYNRGWITIDLLP